MHFFGGRRRGPANQRLKLTGAAIQASRDIKLLPAAPAAYRRRSALAGPYASDRISRSQKHGRITYEIR
jgi:hypothetical protein